VDAGSQCLKLEHWLPDTRLSLFLASAAIYGSCRLYDRPDRDERAMPLLVGPVRLATFIWFAENLGAFARARTYPSQEAGWRPVLLERLGAWSLLVIISFVLVAAMHGGRRGAEQGSDA
jgi:uncharacterized membrane protein YoaT (DUF817 family)